MKKIPTVFHRIFKNQHKVGIVNEITSGCKDAFLNGKATIKYDGSCCAIIDGTFYKRYDVKQGKTMPDNAIPCQDTADAITGHFPCWVPVDWNSPGDKWFVSAYESSVHLINNKTYEAIGKHFNGNPYHMEYDTLIAHGETEIKIPRTFESVKEYLRTHKIEGIVFWLDDEPICKIKRSDFGYSWNQKPKRLPRKKN